MDKVIIPFTSFVAIKVVFNSNNRIITMIMMMIIIIIIIIIILKFGIAY